jgi:hypothetical protein
VTVAAPITSRDLHPRHGTHAPTTGTPLRRPGSVRRTTTIDMLRPDGMLGPVQLHGRGRDLVTGVDGVARIAAESSVHAVVAFVDGRTLTEIASDPDEPRLAALLGARVSSGFRSQVDDAVPDHRRDGSLLCQLLDDLPVATLVSGYAIGAAGAGFPASTAKHRPTPDLCAGWRTGGTIMVNIESVGSAPVVTGPVAPAIDRADDPVAWHHRDVLPTHGMRRARRLDISLGPDGAVVVDSLFRDSYQCVDGVETVVHEYTVAGTVDPATMTFVAADATPRALPWLECPAAAASAERLAGRRLDELRNAVRSEFTGTTTCTHLNDQLRSLADVVALVRLLPASEAMS